MAEITIDDVHVISDGNTLTFARLDLPSLTISLDATGVAELIDFITSLAGAEFNRRRTFRIPVHDSSGLSVQIRKDEKQYSVTPTNISLTGISVVLHPNDWLDLSQDDDLEVILEFEGETQTLHGVVRCCKDNGFGLFFPESMNGDQMDPSPEISRLVMELQRRWIALQIQIERQGDAPHQ